MKDVLQKELPKIEPAGLESFLNREP